MIVRTAVYRGLLTVCIGFLKWQYCWINNRWCSGLEEAKTRRGFLSFPICGDASVIFSNLTWPSRHRSRSIQKGAIITGPSFDIAGEGVGFGLPVAFYAGRPVFSTHARLEATNRGVKKVFMIDAISRKNWSSHLLSRLPGPGAFFD